MKRMMETMLKSAKASVSHFMCCKFSQISLCMLAGDNLTLNAVNNIEKHLCVEFLRRVYFPFLGCATCNRSLGKSFKHGSGYPNPSFVPHASKTGYFLLRNHPRNLSVQWARCCFQHICELQEKPTLIRHSS